MRVPITISFSIEMIEKLKEIAHKEGTSTSAIVVKAVEEKYFPQPTTTKKKEGKK